jgi:uncharacterized membrane protein YdfJ with MMPL/SSD domain
MPADPALEGTGTRLDLGQHAAFDDTFPGIIGTSAEFGLNMMFRYLEGRSYGGPLVARSTVMAVALSGIQTMVGFGSLMIAAHRGIFSLGVLLTMGMACGLVASLVVLPVILQGLSRRSGRLTEVLPISSQGEGRPPKRTGTVEGSVAPRFDS